VFEESYGFAGGMVPEGWQRAAHRALDADLSTEAQAVHRHRQHATRLREGDEFRIEIRGHWFFPVDPAA
jgi:hypothetical protein